MVQHARTRAVALGTMSCKGPLLSPQESELDALRQRVEQLETQLIQCTRSGRVPMVPSRRETYLLSLADAVRQHSDPQAVKADACRLLGVELGADRVFYAEVEGDDWLVESGYADSVPALPDGRYSAKVYGERVMGAYRAGQRIVFNDIDTFPLVTPAQRDAHVALQCRAALAVPLLKDGELRGILAVQQSQPRVWTEEEVALVDETAERTWSAVERARAEAAVRVSEARFRALFDSIDQGFCVIQIMLDSQGRPSDYRFLQVNPMFERQTGLTDPVGRTARELVPDLEDSWFDVYGKVALTGEAVRFESRAESMDRWFDVHAFRFGPAEDLRVALLFSDITERRRNQDAIRLSEQRFRSIVLTSASVVWTADPEGRLMEENPSITAFLGKPFPAYRGWGWLAYVHPGDRAQATYLWQRALAHRQHFEVDVRLRRHDGVYRHVVVRGTPVLDPADDIREWVGTWTDIHERVHAREKLEFLNRLAEDTRELADPEVVMQVLTRLLGEHLQVSRCAYAEVELDSDTFTILRDYTAPGVPSTAGHYQLSLFGPRAASDQRSGHTLVISDVDRELTPTGGGDMFNAIGIKAIICCPLIKEGKLAAMMAVHQTTPRRWTVEEIELVEAVVERAWAYIERSRAMRNLASSEKRFRELAEAVPSFVWTALPNGHITYFNSGWFAYTGLTPEESLGERWIKVLPEEDARRVHPVWLDALSRGVPYSVESRYRRLDGVERWFLALALPIRDEDGRIVQWVGTSTDIHEAKLTQEELQRVNRELEEFAYVAGHDLQEPIRMVKIFTELLLRRFLPDHPEAQHYASVINRNVLRMHQLIHDLLEYSRAVQAERTPIMGTANLNAALENALSVLQIRIEEAAAVVEVDPLPLVVGDTKQLSHVLQNLLSNALKYRSDLPPHIRITAQASPTGYTIEVRDNGIGFPPQYAQRIFGLFKRLHKDEYPGTGLGLAICQRIVERYGGRMWAEGRPGIGASFYFYLPRPAGGVTEQVWQPASQGE